MLSEYNFSLDRKCITLAQLATGDTEHFIRRGFCVTTKIYGPKFDTECFVCEGMMDNNLYLVFRGTEVGEDFSFKDIVTDIKFKRRWHVGKFKLHRGFLDAWQEVRHDVLAELWSRQSAFHEGYRLVIVGHSLGGALACVAAYDLSQFRPFVITFGQPRVGGKAFAKWLNTYTAGYRRYVYRGDGVTHVPFGFGYRHGGDCVYLGKSCITINPSKWLMFRENFSRFFRRFLDHNATNYNQRIVKAEVNKEMVPKWVPK